MNKEPSDKQHANEFWTPGFHDISTTYESRVASSLMHAIEEIYSLNKRNQFKNDKNIIVLTIQCMFNVKYLLRKNTYLRY